MLALGAVTTVLVAWGLKTYHYVQFFPDWGAVQEVYYLERADRVWLVFKKTIRGRTVVQARGVVGTRQDDERHRAEQFRDFVARSPGADSNRAEAAYEDTYQRAVANPTGTAPGWAKLPEPGTTIVNVAYGWPWPALLLWQESPWLHSDRPKNVRWIPTSWRPTRRNPILGAQRASSPLTLPLEPIAIGFVVNTMVYGAVWWMLLVGIRLFIRRMRFARGRCPRCCYDITGLATCPECGTPIRRPQGRMSATHPR